MKIKPAFSEFKEMAQQGNLIPVYQEFLADTETPVSAYLKLKDESYSYLLESADHAKRWGRYSFIGCKPYLRVLVRDGGMEIWKGDELERFTNVANPLDAIRGVSAEYKAVIAGDLPPFQGGLVANFCP